MSVSTLLTRTGRDDRDGELVESRTVGEQLVHVLPQTGALIR
jgi:hypothetical protein